MSHERSGIVRRAMPRCLYSTRRRFARAAQHLTLAAGSREKYSTSPGLTGSGGSQPSHPHHLATSSSLIDLAMWRTEIASQSAADCVRVRVGDLILDCSSHKGRTNASPASLPKLPIQLHSALYVLVRQLLWLRKGSWEEEVAEGVRLMGILTSRTASRDMNPLARQKGRIQRC